MCEFLLSCGTLEWNWTSRFQKVSARTNVECRQKTDEYEVFSLLLIQLSTSSAAKANVFFKNSYTVILKNITILRNLASMNLYEYIMLRVKTAGTIT